jgi:hypothetical protein
VYRWRDGGISERTDRIVSHVEYIVLLLLEYVFLYLSMARDMGIEMD